MFLFLITESIYSNNLFFLSFFWYWLHFDRCFSLNELFLNYDLKKADTHIFRNNYFMQERVQLVLIKKMIIFKYTLFLELIKLIA